MVRSLVLLNTPCVFAESEAVTRSAASSVELEFGFELLLLLQDIIAPNSRPHTAVSLIEGNNCIYKLILGKCADMRMCGCANENKLIFRYCDVRSNPANQY